MLFGAYHAHMFLVVFGCKVSQQIVRNCFNCSLIRNIFMVCAKISHLAPITFEYLLLSHDYKLSTVVNFCKLRSSELQFTFCKPVFPTGYNGAMLYKPGTQCITNEFMLLALPKLVGATVHTTHTEFWGQATVGGLNPDWFGQYGTCYYFVPSWTNWKLSKLSCTKVSCPSRWVSYHHRAFWLLVREIPLWVSISV